jgi:SUKH-3 immunity protein
VVGHMREDTERVLRAAGWYPGRCRDASAARSALELQGYKVDDRVEQFLREFDDLRIPFLRHGRIDEIRLDAVSMSTIADDEWVAYYSERIKTSLVPIGLSSFGHLMQRRKITSLTRMRLSHFHPRPDHHDHLPGQMNVPFHRVSPDEWVHSSSESTSKSAVNAGLVRYAH